MQQVAVQERHAFGPARAARRVENVGPIHGIAWHPRIGRVGAALGPGSVDNSHSPAREFLGQFHVPVVGY